MLAIHSQAGMLAGGEAETLAATAMEQKAAGTLAGHRQVLVDRLARLISTHLSLLLRGSG